MGHSEKELPQYEDILSDKEEKEKDMETEKDKLIADVHSATSISISDAPTLASTSASVNGSERSFHPVRQLRIDACGIGLLRLPLPSSQLEIPVYDADNGSLAYVSTRSRRCSGDAILSHPLRGAVVSTTYFFGPCRDPVVRVLSAAGGTDKDDPNTVDVPLSGKWTSRAVLFRVAGRMLEWSYAKGKDRTTGENVNLIVLRCRPDNDDASKEGDSKILAQLIRSKDTRSPGSSRCTAGNGGLLVIDRDAEQYLDECLVVATCLIMLKREIDRRRMLQMAMIAGAAGGAH
ncbi:hypothetical protein VTN77DRAFT_9768 [Rasamsonia byssochlamydoides]|uniref:uncharacterized protein n=1 Tax=Rasamsonia byssochlamydoides TaxID=89139 RepID=UPI0037444B6E